MVEKQPLIDIQTSSSMKRLTIFELEKLRSLDPDLNGCIAPPKSLVFWIMDARRQGFVSDDGQGLFLTRDQLEHWKRQGAALE